MRTAAPGPERTADESLLLRRFQEADGAAFEALYRSHCGRIYGYVLRMTGAVETAEELTQEVFVRAWHRSARGISVELKGRIAASTRADTREAAGGLLSGLPVS